jgi:CBS domain-containing protein
MIRVTGLGLRCLDGMPRSSPDASSAAQTGAVAIELIDLDQGMPCQGVVESPASDEDRGLYSFLGQVVADYMTRNVKTVTRSTTLRELGDMFEYDDFNAYPVNENSEVVGLVSKFDFLACFVFTTAHMIPRYEDLMERTVADVMTSEFIYVGPDTKLTRVLQLMVDHRLRSMPVIDGRQQLAGIISREDVIRALRHSVGLGAANTWVGP